MSSRDGLAFEPFALASVAVTIGRAGKRSFFRKVIGVLRARLLVMPVLVRHWSYRLLKSLDGCLLDDCHLVRVLHFIKLCWAMGSARSFLASFYNLLQAQNPFSKVTFIELFLANNLIDVLQFVEGK